MAAAFALNLALFRFNAVDLHYSSSATQRCITPTPPPGHTR
ncbi:MAG: hypothetical protein ACLUMK_00185 [Christensenellales bacterium]